MEDVLATIEQVGAGSRYNSARLCFRAKIGFHSPFGEILPRVLDGNLSSTGFAVFCENNSLSQDLLDTIWKIDLYLYHEEKILTLVCQLVRVTDSGWIAFQYVRLNDEESAVIESLVQRYSEFSSIESPVDLTLCTMPVVELPKDLTAINQSKTEE